MTRAKALALALGSANYDAIWPVGVPGLDPLEPDTGPEATRAWTELRDEIAKETRPKWRADLKAILVKRLAEIERRLEELEARPDAALAYAAVAATFDLSEQPERLRRFIRSRERERRHLIAELEQHRRMREEHPNGGESEAVEEPETVDEPAEDAEQRPDTPRVAEKWLRSGNQVFDGISRPQVGDGPGMRASG